MKQESHKGRRTQNGPVTRAVRFAHARGHKWADGTRYGIGHMDTCHLVIGYADPVSPFSTTGASETSKFMHSVICSTLDIAYESTNWSRKV